MKILYTLVLLLIPLVCIDSYNKWKNSQKNRVVYLTVLCDHPYLVSLLFAILLSYVSLQ